MSELTERLRRHAEWAAQGYDVLFTEAADRIDELEEVLRQWPEGAWGKYLAEKVLDG